MPVKKRALRGAREDYKAAEHERREARRHRWPPRNVKHLKEAPTRGYQRGYNPPRGSRTLDPKGCQFRVVGEFFPATYKGLLQARLAAKDWSGSYQAHPTGVQLVCGRPPGRLAVEVEAYRSRVKVK